MRGRLVAEGVIDTGWVDANVAQYTHLLEGEFEAGTSYKPNKADWFAGRWSGLIGSPPTVRARAAPPRRGSHPSCSTHSGGR